MSVGGIWPTIAPIAKGILSPEMNNIHPSGQPELPLRAIPPLTALLAFERAATQLSFRRAARDLALSPSAISHQIRGLEAAVRHQAVRPRRALGAADRRRRALSGKSLGGAGEPAGGRPRHAAATPRRRRRTLDQLVAVLHLDRAAAGAAGFQAAQSRPDAAHRGHPPICRLQRLARRRRDPLWPRTFDRPEIRAAGRGQPDCRCVRPR